MTEAGAGYRKFLDPTVLSRIGGLELRARLIVEGYFTGLHHSPYRGLSVEYADHRQYVQGDDIRHIDWKVFGRTDKYYIKEYEQETNLTCLLVVDTSESMSFRSAVSPWSKHEYAISLAASLAYLSLQQGDAVGLALFDAALGEFVRPSNASTQWKTVIQELEGKAKGAKTSLSTVFDDLAERLPRRTLVFVISDFLDDVASTLRGLRHLRYRRHEVAACHLWDRAELTFDLSGPTMFEGLEGTGRLLTEPRALRERYLAEVERFRSQLQNGCSRMMIDYVSFDTSTAMDVALSAYLASRATRMRRRTARGMTGG
ncbi:MAG: hypothetical protein BroJett003_17900 [Planctomycetota bacterium]|nr:MAG: hypothetical protein BroJett003_17900 [Planctomycetota bacterium]